MISTFLKAKHWQVFTISFALPIILMFILIDSHINQISDIDLATQSITELKVYIDLVMIFYSILLYSWFWSIYFGLQPKIPSRIKFKTNNFKIFFFIFLTYIIIFYLLFHNILGFNSYAKLIKTNLVFILLPLHLFSIFCMFYIFYFTAKVFKTAELQRQVSFSEFSNDFFLFWVSPIGVWTLQPKINKMIDQH